MDLLSEDDRHTFKIMGWVVVCLVAVVVGLFVTATTLG